MALPLTNEQKKMIDHLESTYLGREYVSGYDLAVTQKPAIFRRNRKKDRQYTHCVDSAKDDLKILRFYFNHLKPLYRLRILNSKEFTDFIDKVLFAQGSFHLKTREEQIRSLKIALQMLDYAKNVIKANMPEEFQEVLDESSKPFWRTIKAISAYQKHEKIKDSPEIQSKFIDSTQSGVS